MALVPDMEDKMKCKACDGWGFAGANQMVGDRYPPEFVPLRACEPCEGSGERPDPATSEGQNDGH